MTATTQLLLVEDEPLISEMMRSALEDSGYTVLDAENGNQAMDLVDARIHEIAGLVTDIRLGAGPNGWEIARHARHRKPELPIVYMTGDSGADWMAEGVPKSILLQKPFAAAQAITAISTLLINASSDVANIS
jgi:DNA-binding NtrC family response regulator